MLSHTDVYRSTREGKLAGGEDFVRIDANNEIGEFGGIHFSELHRSVGRHNNHIARTNAAGDTIDNAAAENGSGPQRESSGR